VAKEFNVPYGTLRNHYQGKAHPPKKAHKEEMLLNPAQEQVMVMILSKIPTISIDAILQSLKLQCDT
jgi:hypothetical protein